MPFEAEHQRHIFAALETVPDASLDYLRDLAAAHLAALVEAFFRARAAAHKAAAAAVALVLGPPPSFRTIGRVYVPSRPCCMGTLQPETIAKRSYVGRFSVVSLQFEPRGQRFRMPCSPCGLPTPPGGNMGATCQHLGRSWVQGVPGVP